MSQKSGLLRILILFLVSAFICMPAIAIGTNEPDQVELFESKNGTLVTGINFDNVLKKAKEHSYDLQIADYNVLISKQGVRGARSEYFPKLNLGAGLEYTYSGGNDTINSASYESTANDTYRVGSSLAATTLTLSDGGGDSDALILNESSDNLRLVFGGGEYGFSRDYDEYNEQWQWSESINGWYGINLVHANTLSNNLESYILNNTDLNGIYLNVNQDLIEKDEYGQDMIMGNRCGLETVTTTDHADLDMDAWKNEIVSDIQAWFTADGHTGYTSVYDVFENGSEADKTSLAACYNLTYDDAMARLA